MDVKLPDGTVVQNVPEGTTKAQLMERLQANGHDVSKFEPGMIEKGASFVKGAMGLTPSGMAMKGLDATNELIEKAAYGAGGKVTDMTGSPEAGFAANVATQAIPALLGGSGTAKIVEPATKWGARFLMQSSLKPSLKDLKSGKAATAIETMLQDGYSPTKGGVEAMKMRISELNDEIKDTLANSTAMIDKNKATVHLQDKLKQFEKQVNPGSDVKAIQDAWTEFLSHPLLAGKTSMPVQTAQEMKQATYRSLGDKAYGEQKGAKAEAEKALARGLKDEISASVPGVAGMNKKESDLITAAKIAERRVLMDANKNPIGLGSLVSTPWMLPVWMWDRSPAGKAALGRGLYSGDIPFALGASGIAPFMMRSGRAPEEQ